MLSNLRIVSKIVLLALVVAFGGSMLLAIGCSKNYFEGFATQTDDESLFYTAREYLRTADYPNAILSCTGLSANYLKEDNVAIVCASAYAGRCGYKMDWFLPTNHVLATPIFTYMFQQLSGTTAGMATDCDTAESILRKIGGATARSDDANMFMALLSIYKIGVIVNNLADAAPDDGTLDGAFDACAMSVANQNLIGSALWELNSSVNQLTSTFFTAIKAGLAANCTALGLLGTPENFCLATDPTALTVNQLKGAMSTIKEGSLFGVNQGGAGGCNGGTVSAGVQCNCL